MNSDMNLIFYICWGIQYIIYDSVHSYVWSGTPGHLKSFFAILNLHYVKTELSYDADFLHMASYS